MGILKNKIGMMKDTAGVKGEATVRLSIRDDGSLYSISSWQSDNSRTYSTLPMDRSENKPISRRLSLVLPIFV
jgi:hypothetical protein